MLNLAIANNTDPKAYVASNMAYLVECRNVMSGSNLQQ
jgi:hypothetical protein